MTNDSKTNPITAIGELVERLTNNGRRGEFNKEARDEFDKCADDLRSQQEKLHELHLIEATEQIKTAASNLQKSADQVRARRQELEDIAKKFAVVAQVLQVIDDAVALASAFKP